MKMRDVINEDPMVNPISSPASEPGNGFWEPKNDRISKKEIKDIRKTKITLKHLNRIRKARAARRNEYIKRQKQLKLQYGKPPEQTGGMGF